MGEMLIVSFEGLDGAGKTTQVGNLAKYYASEGKEVAVLSSPSKTSIGLFIRSNFLSFDPWLKDRIFALDIHNSQRQIPESTDLVLWDRHLDSIYSSNREANLEDLDELSRTIPMPHRTFLLDVTPELSWEREGVVSDHPLDMEWLKMKYDRYQDLLQRYPSRYSRIDASKPENIVFANLVARITEDLIKLRS